MPSHHPKSQTETLPNDAASFTDFTFPSNRQQSVILGAPTNLTATGVSATRIDLAWEAPSGFTPEGYRIEVSADGGTTWTDRVADTESTATAYSDTGLTDGDTRHYRVSAVLSGRTALTSNVASATTMATDTTPPAVLDSPALHTVTSSGVELRIAFTEALDDTTSQTPPASAFTANGSQVSVSAVSVAGNRVTLDLRATILRDQTVTVSYTDPTPSDDTAAVQDAAATTRRPLPVRASRPRAPAGGGRCSCLVPAAFVATLFKPGAAARGG